MDDGPERLARPWLQRIRSVEAAAIAGLVFGVTFFATNMLLRLAPPPDAPSTEVVDWLNDGANEDLMLLTQQLAMVSVIAFLWFIGVFRRRVGDRIDEFTGSVFLGSGLVLASLIAVGVSLLTAPTTALGNDVVEASVESYVALSSAGRAVLLVFTHGMAGVFTLTSSTMVKRSGVFPGWLAVVGYMVAASLILSPFDIFEETLLFPAWVMLVSAVVLIHRHDLPTEAAA